ncbi:MAG: bifunctional (p)ppGpp synthetase/guanosine-3',5'-bis(diphosphate) 3'-pyrophosphohydrolase [Micrococcales bacterium]|nr:bifunctional (p)ppGpp synthetase/guanosine-3',5'-bis(diphosphate) 3'-pyrophosphohydrolase [Micrococcales bacterium]NBS85345.1 bifunctional (p)ppGpp synthetase/guanosine-3',5'-bis(diphosphate) 3'-pyrophosphohydrolase [Micrococcales bacterium]NBX94697.1 bifunctional (p)ppGpp synthetase/guanosine-3',5'-bis(diphosphate) 3'-pyrophosphohydrolase [Actinomycetota bacterium]
MSDTSSGGALAALRSRLPRIFTRPVEGTGIADVIRSAKVSHPKLDFSVVERAYQVAERAHQGQTRKSGDPYITHPVAVAQLLADLGIGPAGLAAALLHDTVEDTDYSLTQLKNDFGDEIAMLVDGVTKLDKVKFGENAQAETVRKMVVAMSKDIRVLVIKLADRLHNARTWGFVPEEKARYKAQETLEIYAPLAHRLGISTFKWELEDISFSVLYPKVYDEIVNLVRQRSPKREEFIQGVIGAIDADLKDNKIKGSVAGRPKQYYSIYQKMVVRGREFDDIYDLVGIRVIVPEVRDCYAILGAIHARWNPVPGRFKDYIAMPKFNLYQSLHTTVIGPNGRPVEIQIRTQEMHNRAEYGVAAHWKYKEIGSDGKISSEDDLVWLKHLSDWQHETADPSEFLDALRFEIGAKEVYAFTPKGRVIGLSTGATPVDFAYAVHTEIGHKTMGAKVNGRLVPLETQLHSGDVVEILTSKSQDASPSQDWLQFVQSQRAKSKIKAWFTAERKDDAVERGKDLLAKALRKQNLPIQRALATDSLLKITSDLRYAEPSDLYAAIGDNHLSAQSVVEKMAAALSADEDAEEPVFELPNKPATRTRTGDSGILVRGDADVMVKLARCCTPVPGDDILGFVTRANGVSVHRSDCKNADDLREQSERLIDVSWDISAKALFLVQIQIEALDRGGLLSDVTRVLSEHHVNILSASVSTRADRVALSRFVFEMSNPAALDSLLNAVRRIDNVYDVYRVSNT